MKKRSILLACAVCAVAVCMGLAACSSGSNGGSGGETPSMLTLFGAALVLVGIVFKQLGNLKEEGTRTV